jgi:hypothetical protein
MRVATYVLIAGRKSANHTTRGAMELLTKKVPVNFNYFLFGDDHEGSVFRNDQGWIQLIDHMRSKIDGMPASTNLGLDHGDVIDAIDPKDPRYSASTEKGFILEQIEAAKKNRIAIKDQLVVILLGNHELKKWNYGNITRNICEALGVRYGGWSCKITFKTRAGGYLFKHYAIHGRKTITSTADDPKRRRTNKLLSLKRQLKGKCADAVLMSKGHTHWCDRLKPETDVYFGDDGKDIYTATTSADHTAEYIHPDLRWYVNTGSFLGQQKANSGLTGYAEVAEYDPMRCGYQLCKVRSGVIQSIEPVWVD